ncbi:MAG TPA: hypothetical protein VGL72_25730 [Bryobacteraceae bacterium]|jgi:hypothetical protein
MSPITDAPNGILRWSVRPGRSFILEAEGAELGRLGFSGKSGSLAKGMTAHGEWTFKREGFLHPRITIRNTGADSNCGSLTLSANGNGKLSLGRGEEFNFVTGGWLQSHWSFNRGLAEIVRFSRDGSSADVEIVTPTVTPETLSILVLLGWYAPLLAADEAAVVATISTCTAAIT